MQSTPKFPVSAWQDFLGKNGQRLLIQGNDDLLGLLW
jgi:hypothetical protein